MSGRRAVRATQARGSARPGARRIVLGLALGALLGVLCRPALAQPEPGDARTRPRAAGALVVEARPIFGEGSLLAGGVGELWVRISNNGAERATGEIVVRAASNPGALDHECHTRAPFAVAPGTAVSLRLPIRVSADDDPQLRVLDAKGGVSFEQTMPRASEGRALLVDVSKVSALGAALRGVPLGARNDPWVPSYRGARAWAGHAVTTLDVSSPAYDPATGDPVLPERAAAYSRVAAVVMRSDELVRLGPIELEALSGYLLGGGTLGVAVTRPEDLRHAVLVALLGGEATAGPVASATLDELELPTPPAAAGAAGSGSGGSKDVPRAAQPEPELEGKLGGYTGGNLRASSYGASASYGLGEIHLLAFDPTTKPAVDSAWAQLRLVDLVRRATERRASVLYPPGGGHGVDEQIRRQLDPNEGSRWAIVVSTLLLLAYAVGAGPLNFALWRKRGHPLRALFYLPAWSALAFVLVVFTGVASKGCGGRARHLTLIEAGAGMKVGSARRWRGFFASSQRKLTVGSRAASSVVSSARVGRDDSLRDELLVDRDGARLVELGLRPWETLVVRDDGPADLGDGIALLREGSETRVSNHTGRKLRGLLLKEPGRATLGFLRELEDGASVTSGRFGTLSGGVGVRASAGGLPLRAFEVNHPYLRLETASPGLGDAWTALAESASDEGDWFPDGVPVLLGQIDGGEGRAVDSGFGLDRERLLVRVVGYGGRP